MKKIILGIVLALIMILNTGCEKSPNELISLTFQEGNDHSGVFIFKNESDYDAMYGDAFEIMKKEDGKWSKLEEKNEGQVALIGRELKAGAIIELNIDWEYAYGKLPKGLYKIVKEVTVNDKNYDVYGTFNVE